MDNNTIDSRFLVNANDPRFSLSVTLNLSEALVKFQEQAQAELMRTASRFMTFSGRTLNLLQFAPSDACLEDIAQGLSNTCRYSGQCNRFYSVAEHSVLVSRMIEHVLPDHHPLLAALIVAGLMHDSPEAYLGDMTTPLKILCPGYKIIEGGLEDAIQKALGVDVGFSHPIVKECDLRMYWRERSVLMPVEDELEPTDMDEMLKVRGLSPEESKRVFLERAEQLGVRLAS